jgi:hypothetical protein
MGMILDIFGYEPCGIVVHRGRLSRNTCNIRAKIDFGRRPPSSIAARSTALRRWSRWKVSLGRDARRTMFRCRPKDIGPSAKAYSIDA